MMKALKKVENPSTMNFDSHGVTMWFLKRNQERVEGNSNGAEPSFHRAILDLPVSMGLDINRCLDQQIGK